MQIETVDISRLVPYGNNSRIHSKGQIDGIAASIKEFGFTNPVLIRDDLTVISGHGRIEAAKKLGIADIPCIRLSHLTPEQARAYVIADNALAEQSGWDEGKLAQEITELGHAGFDLDILGLQNLDSILTELRGTNGLTAEDAVPEVPEEPVTKPGDLWLLGEHRLLCGDSTNLEAFNKLVNEEKINCLLTDPPYGMNLDTDYSKITGSSKCAPELKGTGKVYRPVIGDDKPFDAAPVYEMISKVKDQFWFGADYYRFTIPYKEHGSWLVWDKRKPESDDAIGSGFELVWSKQDHQRRLLRHYWCGVFGSAEARNRVHPTQKPITVLGEILERWTKEKFLVYDPFLGSGSTLIACEKTGRICYGMEIDPHYCDVIVKRWEDYTGKKATLERR